jgi:hypothetical protein
LDPSSFQPIDCNVYAAIATARMLLSRLDAYWGRDAQE